MAINTDGIVWSQINSDGSATTSNSTTQSSKLSSTTSKDTAKGQSTLDINDFLKLLVTQMQCQDPLEPTDNTQYIAQMATFTQVEATTEMGNKVEQQMASSLVGKSVIMKTNESSSGMIAGKVNYWENIDGKIYLGINGKLYDIADVDTVLDNDYYDKLVNGDTSKKDDTASGSGKADDTSKKDDTADSKTE